MSRFLAASGRRILWLSSLILLLGGTDLANASGACEIAAQAFVNVPTFKNFDLVSKSCKKEHGKKNLLSNSSLIRLNNHAANGNKWAAKYIALHLKYLDGGNLEDAMIALGQFGDSDMKELLMLNHKDIITESNTTRLLVMMPLSVSDNENNQLDLIKQRKSKIFAIHEKELYKIRLLSISALNEMSKTIKNAYNIN